MIRFVIITLTAIIFLNGCNSSSAKKEEKKAISPISRDLSKIREDGTLRVLLSYSSTSYFIYRAQPMGFEYELLERLAKDLELELELVLVHNMDSIIPDLNKGKVDMIAHGLTITSDRKKNSRARLASSSKLLL